MKQLFNNMLVPIMLGEDDGVALREAVRMAPQWQCNVHVLCSMQGIQAADETAFTDLRTHILQRYRPELSASLSLIVHSEQGPQEKNIIGYVQRHGIDLILLGRARFPFWQLVRRKKVSIDRLLKRVDCPVLTVSEQHAVSGMKNIVLPVGESLPMRKLLFATYLAKTARSTIHLVSVDGRTDNDAREAGESLHKSYRLLRENTNLPVECLRMPGENLAEGALQYARTINADLILIHPGKESLLNGFFDGLLKGPLHELYARTLFNVSRIPVMSVC